jgi:hypothetical protein
MLLKASSDETMGVSFKRGCTIHRGGFIVVDLGFPRLQDMYGADHDR